MTGALLMPKEVLSFSLFQSLNCTVTPNVSKSPRQTNGQFQFESPSRTHKEKEKEASTEMEIDLLNFDRDKMMAHILDCLSALNIIDELYDKEGKDEVNDVKRKVFLKAIKFIMMDRSSGFKIKPDLERLLQSFPDCTKLCDDRKWLSLHWAVLEDSEMDQKEVEILYSSDPMALTRHHLRPDDVSYPLGFTPAHLIAFQKAPNMELVRYLDLHSPRAFLLPSLIIPNRVTCPWFPIQLAGAFSENIRFLQFLLQVQPGAARIGLGQYSTLLCVLLKRDDYNFESFEVLLKCLITIDSSTELINEAMRALIQKLGGIPSMGDKLLYVFKVLLEANRSAVSLLDDKSRLILHYACKYISNSTCATNIIELLLTAYENGAKRLDQDNSFPIIIAAQYSTVEVVKLLLKAYPTAVIIEPANPKTNIIHSGLYNKVDPNMMRYLCLTFPEALKGFSLDRKTPLHELCYLHTKPRIHSMRTMCEIDPSIASMECGAGSHRLGIPLHLLITGDAKVDLESPVSEASDCFRYLLKLSPESASLRDLDGNTSYTLAVILHMNSYFIRLLLKADTTIDIAVLRELNYKERRGGMFLAFSAISCNKKASLFALLRRADLSLLEIVFSFL